MTRAALLLVLTGCGGSVPVYLSSSTARGQITDPTPEVEAVLDEAFAFWERDYHLVDQGGTYGTIWVNLVDLADDGGDPTHGTSLRTHCECVVWSDMDSLVLAHELGHCGRLDDVSTTAPNLMAPYAEHAAWQITDDQWVRWHTDMDRLIACAGG